MEIDSSPEPDSTSPQDRILQRLVLLGVPEESIEQLQPGLVAYVKENKFQIPEIVLALFPTDVEVMEAALEAQADPMRPLLGPTIEDLLHESMIWLQWLMFEGEPVSTLKHLAMKNVGQRGVCGAVWGNNDIAYRCRTCEHDPTCAICVPCFKNGSHKDHDYSIIYTGGGCCDCGDVTAWKRNGFCSKHKGAEQIQPLQEEIARSIGPVLDSLFLFWKTKLLFTESIHGGSTRGSNNAVNLKRVADELTSAVVEMLLEFCKCSESLLSFVSGRVFCLDGLLDILVRAERFLSSGIVEKLQKLLLKLLSDPLFKYEFAKSFLRYYPVVVNEVVKDPKDTAFIKFPLLSTFSVQIFTVPTLTPRLVKEMNLLAMLLECLSNIFFSCAGDDHRLQVSRLGTLFDITQRVVEDIRFVMSHSVIPRYVTCDRRDISRTWMKLLAFVQGMNPQKRETTIHIEEENEHMHIPFVLGHSIANIHSLLVAGAFSVSSVETDDEALSTVYMQESEDQDSLRHAKVGRLSQESSVSSITGRSSSLECETKAVELNSDSYPFPTSASWVTFECLRAIENWLGVESTSGDLFSILFSKGSETSSNIFTASKRTFSKIRRSRNVFKAYSSSSLTGRYMSSQEIPCKQPSSSGQGGLHSVVDMEHGSSDASPAGLEDSSVEGEYTNELEALRVLSLSDWPDIKYDVSSQDISVHIPLHRLLSLVLQRALRRCYGENASADMRIISSADTPSGIYHDFFGHVLGGCHPYGFSAFVMEHPLRIRVFCSEVHAGMWRKNGDTAILSYEWYRSVRWSEQGLELDLFLLQCCGALAPADLYVNRILERFGLSSYLSLNFERSNEYEPVLVQEMLNLIIQIIKERRFCGLTTAESVQRELIYRLSTGNATHSQLVKSLPRDLSKVNLLQEILDMVAEYSNPSGTKQGMYKLRSSYWKELDLYHPRWNSRDLQVAEERYLRFRNVSALTNQLPTWTKIYPPFSGLARIATCKTILQIVRAVMFYALFTDKFALSRAPDGVVVTALHLLSLALDVCRLQKEGDRSCYIGDSVPILDFACEEIFVGFSKGYDNQSLLSLLVSLMRINKKESLHHFMEAGSFDLSSLIENLLKKFAELDSGCRIKLQTLAPEVVDQLSEAKTVTDAKLTLSDGDKRKAKARERQAAIMEKMRAQQSKFMENMKSTAYDELNDSKMDEEGSSSDVVHDSEGTAQVVCSLCHDPNAKSPLSFLILLQKSRLLSLLDRAPPLWEKDAHRTEKKQISSSRKTTALPSLVSSASRSKEVIPSSEIVDMIHDAVYDFASCGQPREVKAFLEFIKARFPFMKSLPLPGTSHHVGDKIVDAVHESIEVHMYMLIVDTMHDILLRSNITETVEDFPMSCGSKRSLNDSLLLGKYIASISNEISDNPSSSESARFLSDKAQPEGGTALSAYDGFGPSDSDGIYLSSCGHAVHQGCLDRYLQSLKERYTRRIDFEGGHIVDPDQGEFLCPVCRGLANSILPDLPGELKKIGESSRTSDLILKDAANKLASLNRSVDSLHLREASSLLQAAADVAGRSEILKAFPVHCNERIPANLESAFRVLCEMYFPGTDKILGSGRLSHPMIMWDVFKYSLTSTEIAARSERTSLATDYTLSSLYKELKSSNGFILSLLLRIVQSERAQSSRCVLSRLRGIQLFAGSMCSGDSLNESSEGGGMLYILENAEKGGQCPDIQFWKRASDPVLSWDAFSTLTWILFCLPDPFLSCEESFLSLVHMCYVVSVTQAVITCCGKHQCDTENFGYDDSLIADISKFMGAKGIPCQYFVSNYGDDFHDIKDIIRRMSLPYLRRCALLWKLVNSSTSAPFSGAHVLDSSSQASIKMDYTFGGVEEFVEIEELEKIFKIPPLDSTLRDKASRSLVLKWLHHFSKESEVRKLQGVLHSAPVIPFKLMVLPSLYQDLLQSYIKQQCVDCGAVIHDDPALCLLCGKLCSAAWRPCCRNIKCETHSLSCGAGTGVFLLIKKTTILLQRSGRRAHWPSPYLDAFGEEDIEMNRGKPLYLNEERYAALTHMVASHGLDRTSKVLHQTGFGAFLML